MSLILEALRKSEAERRRAQAPDLRTELPPAPLQRRNAIPAWAWLLLPASAALLAAIWLLRTSDQAAPRSVATEAGVAATHREKTPALPAVPRLSPPAVVAAPKPPPVAPASEAPPPPRPPVTETATIAAAPKAIPVPVESAPSPAVTPSAKADDGGILQLSDLSAAERKSLPPLKVSMHMWDGDPARRFVIVDGNRLVEGDRVGDAVVTAITADGVLLDWNGRRLKLPIR
jgi:general secretion pathway protein B